MLVKLLLMRSSKMQKMHGTFQCHPDAFRTQPRHSSAAHCLLSPHFCHCPTISILYFSHTWRLGISEKPQASSHLGVSVNLIGGRFSSPSPSPCPWPQFTNFFLHFFNFGKFQKFKISTRNIHILFTYSHQLLTFCHTCVHIYFCWIIWK